MNKRWMIVSASLMMALLLVFALKSGMTDEKKSNEKGFLGVSIEPLDRHLKKELNVDYGVIVAIVELDSPADEFGLMEDDVIQKVNDVKIRRPNTLTRVIRKIKPGEKAEIKLIRDGKEKTISVVIGKVNSKSNKFAFPGIHVDKDVFKIFTGGGPYLGVKLHALNSDLAPYFNVKPQTGALILEVEKDSPAEAADLKAGDVIIGINGEKVTDPETVIEILSNLEKNDEVELEIFRQAKSIKIKATLDERENKKNIFFGHPNSGEEIFIQPDHYMFNWHDKNMKNDQRGIKLDKKFKIKSLHNTI